MPTTTPGVCACLLCVRLLCVYLCVRSCALSCLSERELPLAPMCSCVPKTLCLQRRRPSPGVLRSRELRFHAVPCFAGSRTRTSSAWSWRSPRICSRGWVSASVSGVLTHLEVMPWRVALSSPQPTHKHKHTEAPGRFCCLTFDQAVDILLRADRRMKVCVQGLQGSCAVLAVAPRPPPASAETLTHAGMCVYVCSHY